MLFACVQDKEPIFFTLDFKEINGFLVFTIEIQRFFFIPNPPPCL